MTDTITRNTITHVQCAFFEVCDLIEDIQFEAISTEDVLDRLTEIKELLVTIESRLEGEDA